MDRKYEASGYGNDIVMAVASFVGGGAAANMTLDPVTAFPRIANFGVSAAYSATGIYNVTLQGSVPQILQIIPTCEAGGFRAEVSIAYVPSTRVVQIQVRSSADALADLPTTSKLKLLCICRDSTA